MESKRDYGQSDFFGSLVNSWWFSNVSVILMLSNFKLFRTKLNIIPLSDYFPDYTGGNDVMKASEYILGRFNQVNRAHLQMFSHLCEASDEGNLKLVWAAVKETVIHQAFVQIQQS